MGHNPGSGRHGPLCSGYAIRRFCTETSQTKRDTLPRVKGNSFGAVTNN